MEHRKLKTVALMKNDSNATDLNAIILWLENLVPENIRSEKEGKNETAEMDLGLTKHVLAIKRKKMSLLRVKKLADRRAKEAEDGISLFDLVFGKDLGKGSFANVRYAKRIVRGTAASNWTQEYAVKNIPKNTKKSLNERRMQCASSQAPTW